VAKKHKKSSAKNALSAKSPTRVGDPTPRYASAEAFEKAMARVMKIHGAVLQKLAE
jgi:hypothetical protein